LILVISTRQTRPITTKLATARVELTRSSAEYVSGATLSYSWDARASARLNVVDVPTDRSNDNGTQAMMMRMVLIKTSQDPVNHRANIPQIVAQA
jgi:hypothetical protein